MADDNADAPADGGAGGGKKKLAGKKLVLFIALPLLLLLIGGGAGAFFLLGGEEHGEEQSADAGNGEGNADAEPGTSDELLKDLNKITFLDMPEILVNLNGGGKQANYLKVNVALELDDPESVKAVNAVLPRVVDSFNVYLRELRLEDLSGSAGLVRLKEELMVRINTSLGGSHVKDILFKEMLVQ
ncbi:MAG: flagellar basal body-associated FliL family protein [Alphaproteobacteria bacterium]